MFTGIVSGVGTLHERAGSRFVIACPFKRRSLEEGASIACDGCCLTIVDIAKAKGKGARFAVDVSNETLAGHLVSGHIDGTAAILAREADGDGVRFVLESPAEFASFIAAKGSVALDGVSLTVNDAKARRFGVNLIPYTLAHTTWGDRNPGDLVNLEVDLMARYLARLRESERLVP